MSQYWQILRSTHGKRKKKKRWTSRDQVHNILQHDVILPGKNMQQWISKWKISAETACRVKTQDPTTTTVSSTLATSLRCACGTATLIFIATLIHPGLWQLPNRTTFTVQLSAILTTNVSKSRTIVQRVGFKSGFCMPQSGVPQTTSVFLPST